MATRLVPDSIRVRVTLLLAASTIPLIVVALLLASRTGVPVRNTAWVIGASCVGIASAIAGAGYAVGRPLRLLTDAVEHWKAGGAFEGTQLVVLPVEVANLARAFYDATASLAEHEAQLQSATAQQELLMREIHHRVKNNLQIVASLLSLQANRIRQPAVKAEFLSARDRVHALGTLHRHLYAEGGLHSINMRTFLTELCGQLFRAMGEREGDRITLTIEAPEVDMSSDQAVPLSLIVTEAVSNAIKYAFPLGRRGKISLLLTVLSDTAHLSIHDDGVGIAAGQGETGLPDGLGIRLIRGFARQLGATLEVRQGQGTQYDLRIPLRREGDGAVGEVSAGKNVSI